MGPDNCQSRSTHVVVAAPCWIRLTRCKATRITILRGTSKMRRNVSGRYLLGARRLHQERPKGPRRRVPGDTGRRQANANWTLDDGVWLNGSLHPPSFRCILTRSSIGLHVPATPRMVQQRCVVPDKPRRNAIADGLSQPHTKLGTPLDDEDSGATRNRAHWPVQERIAGTGLV